MLPEQNSSVRKAKLHSNLSKHSSPLGGKSSISFFGSQALTVKNGRGAFYLAPLALLPPPYTRACSKNKVSSSVACFVLY